MATSVDRNKYALKTWDERQLWDELITNVRISQNTISFDINSIPNKLDWQKIPFYNVSAVDRLAFIIGMTLNKNMKNMENLSKNNSKGEYIPRVALTNCIWKLHMIQSSHPMYCELTYFVKRKKSKSNRGIVRFHMIADVNLYTDNSQKRKLICNYKMDGVFLTLSDALQIAKLRKGKKINIISNAMSVSDFPFCSPWKVGECEKKCVFLSDLQQCDDSLRLFANGLVRLENGFDAHPYILGTGDHINSSHSLQSFMQFIHAMLRNKDKIKNNGYMDDRFFDIKQTECALAAIECKIRFIQFVELGQYKVELIKLEMIHSSKFLFGMKVALKVSQQGNDCVHGTLIVAPLFLKKSKF